MIVKPVTVPWSLTSNSSLSVVAHHADRAVALARHVHPAALRALVPDDATVDQRVDVALEDRRELLGVRERHEVIHHQVLLGRADVGHAGSQHARSSIMLCASSRQRGCTRMPVDILSMLPASTACTIAVSAPSGVTSANANGRSSGCFGVGASTHVHDPTVPPRTDLDELVERVARVRVVLQRRDQHLAVARPDAEDPVLLEAGEECADDGPERARIRETRACSRRSAVCSCQRKLTTRPGAASSASARLSTLPTDVTGSASTTTRRSGAL